MVKCINEQWRNGVLRNWLSAAYLVVPATRPIKYTSIVQCLMLCRNMCHRFGQGLLSICNMQSLGHFYAALYPSLFPNSHYTFWSSFFLWSFIHSLVMWAMNFRWYTKSIRKHLSWNETCACDTLMIGYTAHTHISIAWKWPSSNDKTTEERQFNFMMNV